MAQLDLLATTTPDFLKAPTGVALSPLLPSNTSMADMYDDSAPAKADGAYKTISEVAEELDVPTHVLRFWESRFPQVKPQRMRGSRRYYRPADVEVLKKIKTLLYSQGYTIKGAKKHVKDKNHEIHTLPLEVVPTPAAKAVVPAKNSSITAAIAAAAAEAPQPAKKTLPRELSSLLSELRDLRTRLKELN